jgi:hypothetical protein
MYMKMSVEQWWSGTEGKPQVLRRNPLPVSLSQSKISYGLSWDSFFPEVLLLFSLCTFVLGVLLDPKLNWKQHLIEKRKKFYSSLWICRRAMGKT